MIELLTGMSSFNTGFSIDFCITTRTGAEHSKLSNQALDWMQKWTLALTFTTPFSNVPADKLHPPISSNNFLKKGLAYLQVFMVF